ncbi:hypothetical protein BZL30_0290 [Mycobacterium kansasii]|uniref:Uncharacterized protein n=1 Tax=Mycobacterium kansasii TaxID=1768 RepID=A0A1V3XTJ0_MYCKA|nr:hypothetical protein BZL30_0290 [Mycobacterium kansasii]
MATTVGLAVLAGMITLWLGLMAHFGSWSTAITRIRRLPCQTGLPWCE